ncbi:MAG: YfhO family protein, partial [Elusimicrobia bacterium]|nr:YfhO family protein [Elusimicrobiota bacterium]
ELLAVFALLDPELPGALRAFVPGWALAFLLTYRFFGISNLAALVPFLNIVTPEFHSSVLGAVTILLAAWGFERVRRAAGWSLACRRSQALTFLAVSSALALSVASAFPLRAWLSERIDIGLYPDAGTLTQGNRVIGGIMGGGRQWFLSDSRRVRGWYEASLPVTQVHVRVDGTDSKPVTASLRQRADRVYFDAEVAGSGVPVVDFDVSNGVQLPRLHGAPQFSSFTGGLRWRLAFFALSLAALTASIMLAGRGLSVAVCALLAGAELFEYTLHWVPSVPKDAFIPRTPVVDVLGRDTGLFRTSSFDVSPNMWRPASGSVFGLQDFRPYDAIDVMRVIIFQRLALELFESGDARLMRAARKLEGLANVKYFFSPEKWSADDVEPVFNVGTFHVYRNKGAAPRAMVFETAALMRGEIEEPADWMKLEKRLVDVVTSRPDDFWKILIVQNPELRAFHPPPRFPVPEPREARVVSYEPDRVVIDAEAPRGGFLFLSDAFFPGWKASVDGRPREIFPAWVGFRTVGLEPGDHRVVFEYRPRFFRLGYRGVSRGRAGLLVPLVGPVPPILTMCRSTT